jgi:hypothetical protein
MIPLKTVPNKQKSTLPTKEKDDKKNTITRRNPPNKYQYISLDIVILAIILDIKQYIVKLMEIQSKNVQRYKNNKYNTEKRNYNSFSPLQNFNIECQKCNNYGHKTSECRLPMQSLKIGNPNKQNKKKMEKKI